MSITAAVTAATPVLGGLFNLVDSLFTTEEEKAEAKLKILELHSRGALAQLGVNSKEAEHKSIFVAGWRPFVGWVCAVALAWTYVGLPVVHAGAFYVGQVYGIPVDVTGLPAVDLGGMMPILLGMLGLGALRTFEKVQGVSSNSMKD